MHIFVNGRHVDNINSIQNYVKNPNTVFLASTKTWNGRINSSNWPNLWRYRLSNLYDIKSRLFID